MLCEIGGTVGDIEGLPFFEAIRQFSQDKPRGQCIFMHLTLLPFIKASGELKTKPTQHSVKELRSIGIAPDILVCRSEGPIPAKEREKLALFCNVRPDAVIAAQDLSYHPIYIALAIGCGSKPISWMNDSGFWVISKMSGLTEKEMLKTNTIMGIIMGTVGLAVCMIGAAILPMV